MPATIVQKHPRLAQDDTAVTRKMKTLLRYFDRLAASAASKREPQDIDGARQLVSEIAKGKGLWTAVTPDSIETVALAVASDMARRRCCQPA